MERLVCIEYVDTRVCSDSSAITRPSVSGNYFSLYIPNQVILGDLSWRFIPKVVLLQQATNSQPQSGKLIELSNIVEKHLIKHIRELFFFLWLLGDGFLKLLE